MVNWSVLLEWNKSPSSIYVCAAGILNKLKCVFCHSKVYSLIDPHFLMLSLALIHCKQDFFASKIYFTPAIAICSRFTLKSVCKKINAYVTGQAASILFGAGQLYSWFIKIMFQMKMPMMITMKVIIYSNSNNNRNKKNYIEDSYDNNYNIYCRNNDNNSDNSSSGNNIFFCFYLPFLYIAFGH